MLNGTYNFNDVKMIFGIRQIKGFEDGTEIEIDRDEASFTKKADVDGNVTRSRSNNNMGTVTFTLSQFSKSNKFLSAIANLDERSGTGVFPLLVKDTSNPDTESSLSTQAWIEKPSAKTYGRESGPRVWVLHLADLNYLQL